MYKKIINGISWASYFYFAKNKVGPSGIFDKFQMHYPLDKMKWNKGEQEKIDDFS